MAATARPMVELKAPPPWRTVDFISDLHLHASEPATFEAWQHYLTSTPADAVFILGDLFEVWVGDDAVGPDLFAASASFEDRCAQVLRQASGKQPVFFMRGNRDFLVGQRLMALCNTTFLEDPTVLQFEGQRFLLSHGDALCIDDVAYMQFREQVRSPQWQQAFLSQPLAQRQAVARGLRQQSEARKKSGVEYADVDAATARQWLLSANAQTLIHGHTHRPAQHALGEGMSRVVLSDWHVDADPVIAPRAEVMRLSAAGLQRIALV